MIEFKEDLIKKYTVGGGSLQNVLTNKIGASGKELFILHSILYELTVNNEHNERIIELLEKMTNDKPKPVTTKKDKK